MKTLMGAIVQNDNKRLGWLDIVKPNSQDVNTNSYPKAMLHASRGIRKILCGPGRSQMQMRNYPSKNNSVLNSSQNDSENDSKKTIPKAKKLFQA